MSTDLAQIRVWLQCRSMTRVWLGDHHNVFMGGPSLIHKAMCWDCWEALGFPAWLVWHMSRLLALLGVQSRTKRKKEMERDLANGHLDCG